MRFGFVLPRGDARDAAELAAVAEDAGWDGFFVWESVWGVDAWMALAAAAVRPERIRLGTMLTPLPRKRPWELAGQTATLDNLSGGRTILSVGLGAPHEGWLAFEPDPGRRTRAELLDEGLAWIREHRAAAGLPMEGYDVVAEGATSDGAAEVVGRWRDAGATWWIEADWGVEEGKVREYAHARLRAGPPR